MRDFYIHIETGARVTAQQIREAFPNISFPVDFEPPEGYEIDPDQSVPETPGRARMEAKQARAQAIFGIVVTTSTGKTFDGDEDSQNRMTRAVLGLQLAKVPSIRWTLADNTEADVTLAELSEALVLAGMEQARLWSLQ